MKKRENKTEGRVFGPKRNEVARRRGRLSREIIPSPDETLLGSQVNADEIGATYSTHGGMGKALVGNLEVGKKTPWPLFRKGTAPTERPPLVGEVSANILRIEGVTWSAKRIPRSRFSRPEPLFS
jgi:hypothetical protein